LVSTSSTERSRGSRARLPLRLTWITLALCAVAAYPAYRFGGWESVTGMALGAALSLVTIVISYLLLSFAFRRSRQLQSIIVLGGFVLRVALLFLFLSLVSRTMAVELEEVVLWLVSFYLVLVVVEARELAAQTRRGTSEA